MEIALVTCDGPRAEAEDKDRPFHNAALAKEGVDVVWPIWTDASVDWSRFDLIVIRSLWDYTERFDEFTAWLDRVGPLSTFHNPAAVIRWNMDKRYLGALAEQGVPVVPTSYITADDEWRPPTADEIVVKPTISAGSRLTGRFSADDPAAQELAGQIWAAGKCAMVQPAIASVATEGETAVVAFDGEISHAFTKGPFLALGGGFLGGEYTEVVEVTPVTDELAAVVARVQEAIAHYSRDPLLYARYDFVRMDDGSLALLEAELFEPSLFLPTDPSAAARFAAAAVRRATP